MKIALYSTSTSSWYQKEADKVAAIFSKRVPMEIEMISIDRPKSVQTIVDSDGDTRLTWDWLRVRFPLPEGYDGVGFHFTSYYKDKWGIRGLKGSKNSFNKEYPEFWFSSDKGDMAEGYEDLSDFARILLHELSHFFEDLDDEFGNKLMQESVHLVDYELKQIHLYPLLIDYRGWELKRKVAHLVTKVLNLVPIWKS